MEHIDESKWEAAKSAAIKCVATHFDQMKPIAESARAWEVDFTHSLALVDSDVEARLQKRIRLDVFNEDRLPDEEGVQ